MISVEERIQQLRARAKQRGFRVDENGPIRRSGTPKAVRPTREAQSTSEQSERNSLLYKSLPAAWLRAKHKTACERDAIKTVETRAAARLVCLALGDDWRREIETEHRWSQCLLVHRDGLELNFGSTWNDNGRYTIGLKNAWPKTRDVKRSITVSATRTPASIAGDIERRLLGPTDAVSTFRDKQFDNQRERSKHIARRKRLLDVISVAGETHLRKNYSNHREMESNPLHFLHCEAAAELTSEYRNAITLRFETQCDALAALLLKTARNYVAENSNFPNYINSEVYG